MSEVEVRYGTLVHSTEVLERQRGHAQRLGAYVQGETSIADSTGALLAALAPLSSIAVALGTQAAHGVGTLSDLAADRLRDTTADYVRADAEAHAALSRLASRLGENPTPWSDPRSGVPPLGGPRESADADHGSVDSWIWDKAAGAGESFGGMVGDGLDVADQVRRWGGDGAVEEAVDPQSYLVPPQWTENWVEDVRWNAGVVLGGIDWVAEQFIGFSILERCVFSPLGGDWRAIGRASQGWAHAGEAAFAMGRNCAALTAGTVDGWRGPSADAFRAAMTGFSGALVGLSTAYGYASDLVSTIATVSKLACAGIGLAIKQISHILIKIAAEAATPVIGWAVGAATIWWDVEKIIGLVRLVYGILETIATAIADFAEAKASLMDAVRLVEDLVEGLGRRATA